MLRAPYVSLGTSHWMPTCAGQCWSPASIAGYCWRTTKRPRLIGAPTRRSVGGTPTTCPDKFQLPGTGHMDNGRGEADFAVPIRPVCRERGRSVVVIGANSPRSPRVRVGMLFRQAPTQEPNPTTCTGRCGHRSGAAPVIHSLSRERKRLLLGR